MDFRNSPAPVQREPRNVNYIAEIILVFYCCLTNLLQRY